MANDEFPDIDPHTKLLGLLAELEQVVASGAAPPADEVNGIQRRLILLAELIGRVDRR
jgi:hypothetical protein